jgi:hypothetical protein
LKVTLLGINHDVQWKDPTGDLQRLLSQILASVHIDLVAEEACGLPTTVAQRLCSKTNIPWIDIDLSVAERKLAGIYEKLLARPQGPIDPCVNQDTMFRYLTEEDGIREEEWLRRIIRTQVHSVVCLCGFLHVGTFAKRLKEMGCSIEDLKVTDSQWFRARYGTYQVVEKDGQRWCEIRHP